MSTYIQSPSPSDLKEGCCSLSPMKESQHSATLEASNYDSFEFDEKSPYLATHKANLPYVPSFISAFRAPESSRQMAIREMDRSI